jgi:hypothetical protein
LGEQQEEEWDSISDGHLLDYILGIEAEMEGKRIAESETENTCGIHSYSILRTLIFILGLYRFYAIVTNFIYITRILTKSYIFQIVFRTNSLSSL